jgi:hypothetical protein
MSASGHDFYYCAGEGDRRGEYVVRVRWLVAWPREEAFWIPGLYANQNSVTGLRERYTLERLSAVFGVA